MTQQNVERVIGRLATDESLRRAFALHPESILRELITAGLDLTPIELQALLTIDPASLQRLADLMDTRIQRAGSGK